MNSVAFVGRILGGYALITVAEILLTSMSIILLLSAKVFSSPAMVSLADMGCWTLIVLFFLNFLAGLSIATGIVQAEGALRFQYLIEILFDARSTLSKKTIAPGILNLILILCAYHAVLNVACAVIIVFGCVNIPVMLCVKVKKMVSF